MIALVDCNNFYTSCERAFRPDLKDQPIVVLSNNDGCIISRSQEAKDLGVPMGAPFFKVKKQLHQLGIHYFSSNYTLYGDMSARVVECIDQFSSLVEVYSVDEAFATLHGSEETANQTAFQLRETILQWTAIPVKIGVAPSKTLAKIAATIAKKTATGVYCLSNNEREQVLKNTPITDVWGVGKGFAAFLERHGIHNAYQLSACSNTFVRKHLGVVGLRLVYELRGVSCLPVTTEVAKRKMIMTSRSFSHPVTTLREMREAVASYVKECGEKLRGEELLAGKLTVQIRTFAHRENEPQHHADYTLSLKPPTDQTIRLTKVAQQALHAIYRDGYKFKKAGVLLSELVPKGSMQTSLFNTADSAPMRRLTEVMDHLNSKYGKEKVRLLSQGVEQPWKMNSQFHSKRATTRWNELIEI